MDRRRLAVDHPSSVGTPLDWIHTESNRKCRSVDGTREWQVAMVNGGFAKYLCKYIAILTDIGPLVACDFEIPGTTGPTTYRYLITRWQHWSRMIMLQWLSNRCSHVFLNMVDEVFIMVLGR